MTRRLKEHLASGSPSSHLESPLPGIGHWVLRGDRDQHPSPARIAYQPSHLRGEGVTLDFGPWTELDVGGWPPGAHPSWLPVPGLALTLTLTRPRTRPRTRDTHTTLRRESKLRWNCLCLIVLSERISLPSLSPGGHETVRRIGAVAQSPDAILKLSASSCVKGLARLCLPSTKHPAPTPAHAHWGAHTGTGAPPSCQSY